MTTAERATIDSLEGCLGDGMTAYKNVVSICDPLKLLHYVSSATTRRERNHRLRVLAQAFAVAFEFDGELPYRIQASHARDHTSVRLFEALTKTDELQPEFADTMVSAGPLLSFVLPDPQLGRGSEG